MTVQEKAVEFEDRSRPATLRNRGDRPFDCHPAVHVMTIAAYSAFVGILAATFMGQHLVVPAGILAISIAALFGVPGLWAALSRNDTRKQSWSEFLTEGMECLTGKLSAGAAMAQILVLPGLMVCLALVFVIIKATL